MPTPTTPSGAPSGPGATPASRTPAPPAHTTGPAPGSTAAPAGPGSTGAAGAPAAAAPTPVGKATIIEKLKSVGGLADLPAGWLGKAADTLYDPAITDASTYDAKVGGGQGANAVAANVSETGKAFIDALDHADPIARQKVDDVENERYLDATLAPNAKQLFYDHVRTKILDAIRAGTYRKAQIYAPYMQNAGRQLGLTFKGKQLDPADWASFPDMFSRNTGVQDVFNYGVSNANLWKMEARNELIAGAPAGATAPDSAVVNSLAEKKFRDEVAGKDLVGGTRATLNASANATYGASWFTPDAIVANDRATNGYADAMRACSLQPEWYPQGTVILKMDRTRTLSHGGVEIRKPTAYDGLMSAMWVARNQPGEEWGVLGSGLREALVNGFQYGDVVSAQAHIPPAHYIDALLQAKADYEAQNVSQFRRGDAQAGTMTEQIARNTSTDNPYNPDPESARPDGRFGAVKLGQTIVNESNHERQNPTPQTPMTPMAPV